MQFLHNHAIYIAIFRFTTLCIFKLNETCILYCEHALICKHGHGKYFLCFSLILAVCCM